MSSAPEQALVIYDGQCLFCHWAVNFIIQRDPDAKFLFSPMQSTYAQKQLQALDATQILQQTAEENCALDTLVLIQRRQCLLYSDAALTIAAELDSHWRILACLLHIPRPLRDSIYRFIGRIRYRIFGRTNSCIIPNTEQRQRFIL